MELGHRLRSVATPTALDGVGQALPGGEVDHALSDVGGEGGEELHPREGPRRSTAQASNARGEMGKFVRLETSR
jgi:hypothetical protein